MVNKHHFDDFKNPVPTVKSSAQSVPWINAILISKPLRMDFYFTNI